MAGRRNLALDRRHMTSLPSSPLVIGNAAAASAFAAMRNLGVECILNVTADIIEPSPSELGNIEWYRIPLQDIETQDVTDALNEGLAIIDQVAAGGGKVLIHCHEGRSRSVTLALAYLIARDRMPLADAINFIKSHRPEAQPNAGFMRQLMALELSTLGANSMTSRELPKSRPKCLTCDICGQSVGLKSALESHLKLKHNTNSATLAAVGVRSVVETELTALLQRANPAKVANIPNLLEKYAGKEHELLAQVMAKYTDAAR
jgi:atypical dual specificity phosphatase